MSKTWGANLQLQGPLRWAHCLVAHHRNMGNQHQPLHDPCRAIAIDFPVTGCNRRIADSHSLGGYLGIFRDVVMGRVMTLFLPAKARTGEDHRVISVPIPRSCLSLHFETLNFMGSVCREYRSEQRTFQGKPSSSPRNKHTSLSLPSRQTRASAGHQTKGN